MTAADLLFGYASAGQVASNLARRGKAPVTLSQTKCQARHRSPFCIQKASLSARLGGEHGNLLGAKILADFAVRIQSETRNSIDAKI